MRRDLPHRFYVSQISRMFLVVAEKPCRLGNRAEKERDGSRRESRGAESGGIKVFSEKELKKARQRKKVENQEVKELVINFDVKVDCK